MKTSIFTTVFAAILLCAGSLDAGAQAVNVSSMGILTGGYTWAYGTWHIVESIPDGGADENDFYISIDKYQIRIKDRSLPDIPLAAIPQTNYANNDMDADMFGVGPDELLIEFVGRYGEDTYLILDRSTKTISHFNADERAERGIKVKMEKANAGTVSTAYLEALTSSPIIGTWKNIDDAEDVKTFTADNLLYEFIPARNGGWEHYLWGLIYTYNTGSGLMTARSPFDPEGRRTRTYRRLGE